MLLVIDVTKGVQTQTAECLIIGEICCDRMLIVLNKLDLLEGGEAALKKIKAKMKKTLELTKFAGEPECPRPENSEISVEYLKLSC